VRLWTLGAGQAGALVSGSRQWARQGARCTHVVRLSLRFVTVDTFSTGGAPSRVIGACSRAHVLVSILPSASFDALGII